MRAEGRATRDDTGLFHPLGTSFFWTLQGWKHERDRFKQNASWLRQHGFDYVRILCEVDWSGREIDPSKPQWSDYDTVVAEAIDYLYDELGLRVETTLIGKGTPNDPRDIARRVADVLKNGRAHKVLNVECVNEYTVYKPVSIATMQEMADLVRGRVPNLIALSSPGSWDDLKAAAKGSVNGFTFHSERDNGDNGWRQVRQGYDCKDAKMWLSSNEPPGPGSSGVELTDPLQLAMLRAVSVMCNGSAFVLHTGTGIYGDGKPANNGAPRPPNFWEIPNIEAIISAVRNVAQLLPEGVENWAVANTGWVAPNPVAPFQPDAYWPGSDHGVNKAYAAVAPDGRVIQMPCGVLRSVELTASYPLRDVTVYDPISLQPVKQDLSFAQGEKLHLDGRDDTMVAYIIHGTRA